MGLQTLELPNNCFFAMQFHGDFKSRPSLRLNTTVRQRVLTKKGKAKPAFP